LPNATGYLRRTPCPSTLQNQNCRQDGHENGRMILVASIAIGSRPSSCPYGYRLTRRGMGCGGRYHWTTRPTTSAALRARPARKTQTAARTGTRTGEWHWSRRLRLVPPVLVSLPFPPRVGAWGAAGDNFAQRDRLPSPQPVPVHPTEPKLSPERARGRAHGIAASIAIGSARPRNPTVVDEARCD